MPVLAVPQLSAADVTVWTQRYDNSRTGANLAETALTTSNVNASTFGKVFTAPVDGSIYAQPLYVPGLTIAGATHNVVYVATMENSLYAIDADTGGQLWRLNYGTPVPSGDVQCCCTDITGNIGIESTPVIDTATGTMYLVSRNKNADGTYHQWLRAIDIATGADKFGSPHEIAAVNSGIVFDAKIHNQRPALTLSNGTVYIAWASHNDCGDYHGWVMGFEAANVANLQYSYLTTTNGFALGGVWMSGQGLTVDGSNNLYMITGNGLYDGGTNFGDSILKLGANLTLSDWFTPSNQASLASADQDLGSAGILGLPGTNYMVGGGKDGRLFLLDSANLGKFNSSVDQVVQKFQAVALNGSSTHIHGSPVYWNSPVNGPTVYVWGENDKGRGYKFTGSSFATTAATTTTNVAPSGMPGGILSVSANGSTAGSGILWANLPYNQNANNQVVPGVLRAYDASNLSNELWNTRQNLSRDDYGNFAKFCAPIVANGHVYMATFSNKLVAYGLITPTAPPAPSGLAASPGDSQVILSWTATSGATGYNVYRGLAAGAEDVTPIATGLTSPAYTDTGLTNGTAYYYKVAAVNAIGTSPLSSEVSATPSVGGAAYNGPHNLPGTVQAEDYDNGGEGAGYHDAETANQGGQYRATEGVDIEASTDTGAGYNVGWTSGGEWLKYTCVVSTTGTYTLSFRVAVASAAGTFHVLDLSNGNANITGSVTAPVTGGWQTWTTVSVPNVTLSAGTHVLELYEDTANFNVNWFSASLATPPAAPTGLTATQGNAQVALSWTASSGAASYNIYRGTTAGGESGTPLATGVTATSYTNTGLTNGTTYYYKVAAVNAGGTSALSNEASATPAAPGSLTGSVSNITSSTTINLTNTGTIDWAHWGLKAYGNFNHKATGGTKISNATLIGANPGRNTNNLPGFTWTGGTPTASATNTRAGIYVNGQNNGFSFTAPADTTIRHVKVWVYGWTAKGKLTAHLSDRSAADYVNTSIGSTSTTKYYAVFTLTYKAGSAGQNLKVTWTANGANGNAGIQAAAHY